LRNTKREPSSNTRRVNNLSPFSSHLSAVERTEWVNSSLNARMVMAEKIITGSVGNWDASKRGPRNKLTLSALTLVIIFQLAPCLSGVWAGPPFVTDDPETVEYRHWEFYFAAEYSNDKDGFSGTAPHLEINYGVWPNVQLHLKFEA